MKRILAVTLTIVMLLATLTGCMASQNPSESENTDKADIPTGSTVKRMWDRHHPDDSERSPYFSIFVPELNDTLITFRENFKIYMDNEYLLGGPGHGCESFYLSDLTGDGKPELCFGMNFGSGFTDLRIQIFDYETRECIYTLSDRGFHDYYIFVRNGDLCIKETEYMKQEAVRTGVLSYDGAEINVSWDTEIDATVDRDKRNSITMTIAETLPSCAAFEYQPGAPYCFYAFDSDGKLYRVLWTDWNDLNENDKIVVEYSDIKMFTYPEPTTGWNPQYEITALSVEKRINADESLVSHIQIKSGANTIHPFGSLLWSETDHGDGFVDVMHADYVEITDMVKRCADVIPKLVLDESVSYLVQVNGRVENVYLLTPNGDTYAKSETTFDALSNLEDGTYYVAFEVLLSGNCDPDAPQNSSRYQDIFCLVVGEDDKPATSDMITYSSGDVLSQTVLNNDEKQVIINILYSDKEWISEIPECTYICRFSGSVNVGYCDCGTLSDIGNNRSRKLTDVERESIESLILMLEEPTHSGYEVEIKLLQYTWDGWGISQKTVGACDVAYSIIDALKAMKETGETVPKISDEVFEIGGGQYAAECGTMWIESGNKIYRLTPDLSQICLVETHFGEGKVLEITDEFKTDVNNAWHYAPYDYYKGTYNKGDYTVDLTSVFKSGSTVQLSIKEIQIESGYDPNNTITVELISSVDQEVNIKLHCQQSDDNLAAGDYRTVQLKKGEPTTVDLTFGGWPNFTYWVYIEADFTKAEITINP